MGAAYAWRDSGLANGTRYFYRLEDVDTKSVSTFHGPVSAVPGPPPRRRLLPLPKAAAPAAAVAPGPAARRRFLLPRVGSRPARLVGFLHLSRPTATPRPPPSASSPAPLAPPSSSSRPGASSPPATPQAASAPSLPGFDSLSDPLGAGASLEARPPRRRRRPPGSHRLHPGAREPLLHRPRRRRRRLPAGRRRPGRHRATGPSGSRARPLPRRLPSRAGPPRRRGLPGRGQDPRPRADAPALRRLARRPRPVPTAHRACRLRRRRTLRDRTRTARPQNPPLALRRECLRLPRHVAEGPALRRLRGALPGTHAGPSTSRRSV